MWVGRLIGCSAGGSKELKYETAALKKHPVKEVRVKSESSLGKHPAQFTKHGLIGEGIPEYILLGILETSILITSAGKLPPSGKVILLSLIPIPEHTVSLVYLLELLLGLLLIAGIGVWMMSEGQLSKGSLYICLTGIIRHAKNLVVVFHDFLL